MTEETLRVYPILCRACGVEWQDHPGLQWTCEKKEALREALQQVLAFCRPPEGKGIEENVEYLRRVKAAEDLLK
jgi:hypothetical protein